MRAKDFMLEVARAEEELKLLASRKEHYMELATSLGSSWGGSEIKPSSNSSKTETAAVGLVDVMEIIDRQVAEYTKLIYRAEALIAQLPQERFRKVLTLQYLCGMPPKDVGEVMGYKDRKSVFRVRAFALQELQKLM